MYVTVAAFCQTCSTRFDLKCDNTVRESYQDAHPSFMKRCVPTFNSPTKVN